MDKNVSDRVKVIVLVICASNFERHQNIIKAMRRELNKRGDHVLYVLTNFGVYDDGFGMKFNHGEPAVYSLLDYMEMDGCILEANLGSLELIDMLRGKLEKRKIPTVAINLNVAGIPAVCVDARGAVFKLMTHLLEQHACKKINLVLNKGNQSISEMALDTYHSVLKSHGIKPDENRILESAVGIQWGRRLYDSYDRLGVMQDCDAVICVHDVCAIGLIMELEARGLKVPGDIKVCSLNHSANSIAFRPDITGIDRMDQKAVSKACDILLGQMAGRVVPDTTYYESTVYYRRSCGCAYQWSYERDAAEIFQTLIYNKVEAGSQISSMVNFNNMLEQVLTVEQWGENLEEMMHGLGISHFCCCLNEKDIDYVMSDKEDGKIDADPPYENHMVTVAGKMVENGEEVKRAGRFPADNIIPVNPSAGDTLLVYPVHCRERDYGYIVFQNEFIPIEVYNYRICQDNLGSSIENLHRKMILKSKVRILEDLHMRDQMTNLYNRYGLEKYVQGLDQGKPYSIAMLDMDGLKGINDIYGHLAGNNAICIMASTVAKSVEQEDFVVRYGGDEFLVISRNTSAEYWEKLRMTINECLAHEAKQQRLPYELGMSLGYVILQGLEGGSIEAGINGADHAMYEEKKRRKMEKSSRH